LGVGDLFLLAAAALFAEVDLRRQFFVINNQNQQWILTIKIIFLLILFFRLTKACTKTRCMSKKNK
jgi:hypothetical protein